MDDPLFAKLKPVAMGPCFRRDDAERPLRRAQAEAIPKSYSCLDGFRKGLNPTRYDAASAAGTFAWGCFRYFWFGAANPSSAPTHKPWRMRRPSAWPAR